MNMKVTLKINKKEKSFDIPANRTLLDLLRAQGHWSVKKGCETGDCGNCAVIVDGLAVNSCLMLAAQADGKAIETFESVSAPARDELMKESLMDFGDEECGYCIPGMSMSMKALVDKISDPTEEEMIDALSGNLCRCTQQQKPYRSLLKIIRNL